MTTKDELISYYSKASKHSNYQLLPNRLQKILGQNEVKTKSRFEKARLDYILENVSVEGVSVLDIGSNTGFFAFELLDAGAKTVTCYEGNKEHARFTKLAAAALGVENITVVDSYYSFSGKDTDRYNIALLLNIIHHTGDDYGDSRMTIEEARKAIINELNSLSKSARTLVFQLGFNWHGDPKLPLFERGTKKEMIEFIRNDIENYWGIQAIGIAEKTNAGIKYINLNDSNINRDDSLGEFLNRPLFILKSLKK